MMKPFKNIVTVIGLGALLIALPGCQKPEGPAEKAGKDIDQAVENTGQKVENLGDRIQDTAQGKPADSDQK
jgi:predicted small secreted protein